MTPRAMTAPELALIRSDEQSSELYLGILKPAVIYTARVNQTFTSLDKVVQVTYDTGSGDLADVIPGMTMYVGSSAGASDVGMVRIRKDPTGSIFYVGEESDITWADDLYLTVVDDFNLWARHLRIVSNVAYMDNDIAYTNQHTNTSPIPIIGPRLVPKFILPITLHPDYTVATYVGTWTNSPPYEFSKITNDYADYLVTTSRIFIRTTRATNRGIANIYIDSVPYGTVDMYSASTDPDVIVFDSGLLSFGPHLLKIEVSGTKNPSSLDFYVVVQGFDIETFGATVLFDASLSYCLADTSISAYLWAAPGAYITSGLTTATPTVIYNTPGTYRVSCKLTAANGKITTAYAHVLVYDYLSNKPITQFDLKTCSGSFTEGGWKFQISMWAEADLDSVVNRAMVVLFARDFYGTAEISIGQIADRENIIATGWVNGESIIEDPDTGSVDFTVETAEAWMKRLSGFPLGIQNATSTASAWTNWFNLNVDDSLYHLFYWQSTVIPAIDVFLTGDTRKSQEQYAGGDTTVYDQLTYLLKNTLMGSAGCDRFSRLFCEVDTLLTPPADRSSFEVVINLEKIDWRDQLSITRKVINTTSQMNLSGVVINPPAPAVPIFSLAPGHVYTQQGKPSRQARLLLSSQAQGNQLAALKLAWDNHNYEFEIDLAGNNRMLDVFPSHQFVDVEVADVDTPRGFTFGGNVIIREINISLETNTDEATSFLQISWRAEEETFPGNSCNGDLPGTSSVPTTNFPPIKFAPVPVPPLISPEPVDPASLKNVQVLVEGYGMFYTNNFDAPTPPEVKWLSMNEGLPNLSVHNFDISTTGRCFCQIGLDSIWSAPQPGAPWELVFDTSMIQNPESYPFPRGQHVVAFGINRDVDDELFIVAGLVVTIVGDFIQYTYLGSSSGVSLGTPTFFDIGDSNNGGWANFGDGVWQASYFTIDQGVVIASFNEAGTVNTTLVPLGFNGTYLLTRGRYSPITSMAVGTDPLYVSQDTGQTFTGYPAAPPPYPMRSPFCSDPEGQNMLLGTEFLGLKKSIDGGATWNPTSTLAAVPCVWNLGTSNDWIFSFVGQICYTPDLAATFIYRTGDLQSWTGAFGVISLIRYFTDASE